MTGVIPSPLGTYDRRADRPTHHDFHVPGPMQLCLTCIGMTQLQCNSNRPVQRYACKLELTYLDCHVESALIESLNSLGCWMTPHVLLSMSRN